MNEKWYRKIPHWLLIVVSVGLFSTVIIFGITYYNQNNRVQATDLSSSTRDDTATTTSTTEAQPVSVSKELVQLYVDPKLYSTLYESENDYVQLREAPDGNSKVVEKVYRGEWAEYLATEGEWFKIKTSQGQTGFIPQANGKKRTVEEKQPTKLSELTVALDPGHGGEDTGAQSTDMTVDEKALTLKTAQAAGKLLTEHGVTVKYSRTEDKYLALTEISQFGQDSGAEIFISFHFDDYDYANGMSGSTTYYYYDQDKALATTLNQSLAEHLPIVNNGVRQGNYLVLRENYIASLLLELGYMNSDTDLQEIQKEDYPTKVAQGILQGLESYLAEQPNH